MVNNAIEHNPPFANGRFADIAITEDGSNYYFAYCAFSGFVALCILGIAVTKKRTDRMFFYMCATINIMMCVSYYTMGSNLGMTPIDVEFERGDDAPRVQGELREIFWVRYVQWFINTPIIICILLFTAAVPAPKLLFTLFLTCFMVVMGLVGAVTSTGYKWGFFAFGCAALFYVMFTLIWQSRKYAHRLGSDIHRIYIIIVGWQLLLWILYPICWGVSEGGNVIAPDSEAVFYGILDILAVPFFSILLLLLHRKTDLGRLGLRFRDYDEEFKYHQYANPVDDRPMHGPDVQRSVTSNEAPRVSAGGEDVAHNHGANPNNTTTTGTNTTDNVA